MFQRTLVLVKPDGMQRRLGGEVLSRLERTGLKIAAMKMLWRDEALARRHYQVHEGNPFFDSLIRYITSGPVLAAVLEGEDAIDAVRKAMGDTDPAKAARGTIRGDLAQSIERNLVHGSDGEDTARAEIANFFSADEIIDYATES